MTKYQVFKNGKLVDTVKVDTEDEAIVKVARSCGTTVEKVPEVVVHDEVGACYKWSGSVFMVVSHGYDRRSFVCISDDSYYEHNPLSVDEFKKCLTELLEKNLYLKYIGHRDNILSFKVEVN